jgi:thiol-disulfide isomerase/thioredoxin
MGAVSIGPLVLAADRFAVVLAIFLFSIITGILARRVDPAFHRWSWWVVVGAIVAARLGHVAIHWQNFIQEPWRIPAFWQGGFFWPAGAAAVALTLVLVLNDARQRLWALLPLALSLVVWNVTWQLTGGINALPLPAGTYQSLVGDPVSLENRSGKPMVVNLWASWCPPCRREMPMMADVAATTTNAEFVFANQGEGRDRVAGYLAAQKLDLPAAILDPFSELSRHYGAIGLPMTLFIGADGVLKHAHHGEISREILQSNIARLNGNPSGDTLANP